MIASRSQNQFQSSFAPLGDHLKALMFLSNLNGFNSSPSPTIQEFNQRKVLPRCGRKRTLSDFITFFYLLLFFFFFCCCFFVFFFFCLLHYLCALLLFSVSLVLYFTLFNMFLCVYFHFLFIFVFDIKIFF